MLTPGRVRLDFFINGNAFTEPAGHFVASQLKCHDMTELVPEHRLPIDRVTGMRGGTVGRDNSSETDTQISRISRHAKRAHGEIFLLGKNLNNRWMLKL